MRSMEGESPPLQLPGGSIRSVFSEGDVARAARQEATRVKKAAPEKAVRTMNTSELVGFFNRQTTEGSGVDPMVTEANRRTLDAELMRRADTQGYGREYKTIITHEANFRDGVTAESEKEELEGFIRDIDGEDPDELTADGRQVLEHIKARAVSVLVGLGDSGGATQSGSEAGGVTPDPDKVIRINTTTRPTPPVPPTPPSAGGQPENRAQGAKEKEVGAMTFRETRVALSQVDRQIAEIRRQNQTSPDQWPVEITARVAELTRRQVELGVRRDVIVQEAEDLGFLDDENIEINTYGRRLNGVDLTDAEAMLSQIDARLSNLRSRNEGLPANYEEKFGGASNFYLGRELRNVRQVLENRLVALRTAKAEADRIAREQADQARQLAEADRLAREQADQVRQQAEAQRRQAEIDALPRSERFTDVFIAELGVTVPVLEVNRGGGNGHRELIRPGKVLDDLWGAGLGALHSTSSIRYAEYRALIGAIEDPIRRNQMEAVLGDGGGFLAIAGLDVEMTQRRMEGVLKTLQSPDCSPAAIGKVLEAMPSVGRALTIMLRLSGYTVADYTDTGGVTYNDRVINPVLPSRNFNDAGILPEQMDAWLENIRLATTVNGEPISPGSVRMAFDIYRALGHPPLNDKLQELILTMTCVNGDDTCGTMYRDGERIVYDNRLLAATETCSVLTGDRSMYGELQAITRVGEKAKVVQVPKEGGGQRDKTLADILGVTGVVGLAKALEDPKLVAAGAWWRKYEELTKAYALIKQYSDLRAATGSAAQMTHESRREAILKLLDVPLTDRIISQDTADKIARADRNLASPKRQVTVIEQNRNDLAKLRQDVTESPIGVGLRRIFKGDTSGLRWK